MTDHKQDDPTDGARTGVYLNKRAVSRIDIPVEHTMTAHNDGWRIDFGSAGRLRLLMSEGHNDNLDVAAGDFLLSGGEDLYLSLQAAPSGHDESRAAKEERTRTKQEHRGQGRTAS